MRTQITLSLVVAVTSSLFTTLFVGGVASVAQSPPPCGDMNGDGEVDVSDAVYLLQHLFQQGPLLACADQVGLTPEETMLLREVLPHLSIEFLPTSSPSTKNARTIRFTGVNVQIVNGLGATNGNPKFPSAPEGSVNGLGNLIVGYNEHSLQPILRG